MTVDYVSMMTDEELLYVCHAITGKFLKQYYTKNPAVFQRIAPRRYIKKLSEEDACVLTMRNKTDVSIGRHLNEQIAEWLREIKEVRDNLEHSGESAESALVKTMPDSFFANNLPLYFKLAGEERSSEYISLLSYTIELSASKRQHDSSDDSVKQGTDESAHIQELENEIANLKQTIEAQAHDYSEQITTLESRISAADERANSASKEKDSLEKELRKYHELGKHKVVSEDFSPLDDYYYMSLCEAISDDNGAPRLRRCADFVDGAFTTDFYEEPQRWRLYRKNGIVSDGHWGVWDWKTVPRENASTYIESTLDTRMSPIGVAIVQNCHSVTDIVNSLKTGIEIPCYFDTVLLGYFNGNMFEGVYCNKNELSYVGTRYSVSSSTNLLPVFEILKDDILAIQEDVQIVRYLSLGMPIRTVSVRTPMEIVKERVLNRITWTVMKQKKYSRSDYKTIREYLEAVPTDDINEEIMAACNCSMEEADALLEDFIAKAASILDGTTLENNVMAQVIRNNAEAYAQCMDELRTEWEELNQARITEANTALDAARKARVVEEAKTKELKDEQKNLAVRIEKQKEEIAAQEQLAEDVKTKVLEKIENARKDAASFIAENAFLQTASREPASMYIPSNDSSHYASGTTIASEDAEESNDWRELVETISYGLEEAGVSHSVSLGLSSLLYSAYLNKLPLLLAGPNGNSIANAFSAALFDKMPGRLTCDGDFDNGAFEQLLCGDDSVIVIEQPFAAGWYANVVKLLAQREKFYIALNPFSEDLLVEPTGLWNYCIPVMTDMVVTEPASTQYVSGSLSDSFTHFASKQTERRFKAASFMNLRPMVNYHIQMLGSDMTEMCDGENTGCEYPLLIYPLAYLNGKLDALKERIQDGQSAIPSEIKALMKPFLGDEE